MKQSEGTIEYKPIFSIEEPHTIGVAPTEMRSRSTHYTKKATIEAPHFESSQVAIRSPIQEQEQPAVTVKRRKPQPFSC
jgi:hypothetical protein